MRTAHAIRFRPITAAARPPEAAIPDDPALLEPHARMLEGSPDFRVLRRLRRGPFVPDLRPECGRLGLFVDCETTGLDPAADEVIELAAVPFRFTDAGRVTAVHPPVTQLRQPSRPIPAGVTELTGIADADVAGRAVDEAAILPLVRRAALVVAHNSRFDRPFLEALLPAFRDVPWACSMTEVPWREEGFPALGLPVLAGAAGFFYDAHRAEDDCLAGIELLGRPLPRSGRTAMAELLERSRGDVCRVWAVGSPFAAKGLLRTRGYRWSNGDDGRPRAWHVDVAPDALDAELRFLEEEVMLDAAALPVVRLGALDRFSARG